MVEPFTEVIQNQGERDLERKKNQGLQFEHTNLETLAHHPSVDVK